MLRLEDNCYFFVISDSWRCFDALVYPHRLTQTLHVDETRHRD